MVTPSSKALSCTLQFRLTVTLVSAQPEKAPLLMLVTLSGILTEESFSQFEKAHAPIWLRLTGN